MNPAMIIIIILGAIIGWFLAARFFRSTGEVVKDAIDEVKYQMSEEYDPDPYGIYGPDWSDVELTPKEDDIYEENEHN